LPLRLPKNAITPEQVIRHHRHQWRGGKGGQALSFPPLTCPVISYSDKRIHPREKRKIQVYKKLMSDPFFPVLHHSLKRVFRIEWIFIIPVHDLQA
jgi:hypothetical protein